MVSLGFSNNSIKSISELAGAFVAAWAAIKILMSSRKYIKQFYIWILNQILKTYVGNVAQEKINERLSNIVEQLIDEDIIILKDIGNKASNSNLGPVWHNLLNPTLFKLKSLDLVNETFDYVNSNLRLKLALQTPLICDKYQLLYPHLESNQSIIIEYNIVAYYDNKNEFQISYKTVHNDNSSISFLDFCERLKFDVSDFNYDIDSFKKLQHHINNNINMKELFPLCKESETIDNLLWVNLQPTIDGWTILNLILAIEKNIDAENYKRSLVVDKATKSLIKKFSKLKLD